MTRYLLFLGTTCLLSLYYAISLQAQTNYPLLAMKMKIVKETQACRLPNGYNKQSGCPPLTIQYVNNLPGTVTKTQPDPPRQTVSLGTQMFQVLDNYHALYQRTQDISHDIPDLDQRKAMILIFDFGNPQQRPRSNLEIRLARRQEQRNCNGEITSLDKGNNCLIYKNIILSNHQYLIYHERADYYIPISKVTWTVTAKDLASGKEYPSWSFTTGR
jgi:hypothetical protein